MKILIVYKDGSSSYDNPFVSTLRTAIACNGAIVDLGLEKFWKSDEYYDCVLFQWPGTIYDYAKVTKDMLDAVSGRINYWHAKGSKIAYTRHNSRPHLTTDDCLEDLYKVVESSADIVFHMGRYSLEESSRLSLSPRARHYIVPHQIYESIDRRMPKDEARAKLGIGPESKVILCFGEFRSNSERDMVLEAYKSIGVKNKFLLTPRFFRQRLPRRNPFMFVKKLAERLPYVFTGRLFQDKALPKEQIPFYFSAADIVFIQRYKILNSGNLPMAFYFGKVVVGPNVGNVGEILLETGNPVFNPESTNSVASALEDGFELINSNLGKRNQSFADDNWSQREVGRLIVNAMTECTHSVAT